RSNNGLNRLSVAFDKLLGEKQMRKLLLIALVTRGLAFVPVQHSDAQIFIGLPGIVGIGIGPGAYYGYPYYGYGYYPHGYYYQSYPYYRYYGGPSYYWSHGHRVYYRHYHYYHRHWGDQGHQDEQ